VIEIAGICGSTSNRDLESLEDFLKVHGEESTNSLRNKELFLSVIFNQLRDEDKIGDFEDVSIGLYGEIYSYLVDNSYQSIEKERIEFLREKLANNLNFAKRLNGNFVITIFEKETKELHFITDRLSTKPVFYLINDGDIYFSSKIQSFSRLDSKFTFNQDYITEYFSLERVLGTRTPVENIKQLPPGTISTYNLEKREIRFKNYWFPKYNPINKDFNYFAEKFHNALENALEERSSEDLDQGLMLSGGFDSRLLAGKFEDIECFHMNENMNKEAKMAKEVAQLSGNSYNLLERGENYQPNLLEDSARQNNFYGAFEQNHALGFIDELKELDIIFSAQYSDTLLNLMYTPRKTLRRKYTFRLPVPDLPKDKKSYINKYCSSRDWTEITYFPLPTYIETSKDVRTVLKENIQDKEKGVESHGIYYPDYTTLAISGEFYPITNRKTYSFQEGISDISVNRNPFLDNRVIDLSLQMPLKYHMRRSLVKKELTDYHESLSNLKHGQSRAKPKNNTYIEILINFLERIENKIKESKYSHPGPWTNHKNVMQEGRFTNPNSELCNFEFIDGQELEKIKTSSNYREFYRIITFSKMPLTKKILQESE